MRVAIVVVILICCSCKKNYSNIVTAGTIGEEYLVQEHGFFFGDDAYRSISRDGGSQDRHRRRWSSRPVFRKLGRQCFKRYWCGRSLYLFLVEISMDKNHALTIHRSVLAP